MSCYILDFDHINALLTIAAKWQVIAECFDDEAFRYSLISQGLSHGEPNSPESLDYFSKSLYQTNVESFQRCYEHRHDSDIPEEEIQYIEIKSARVKQPTFADVAAWIQCYEHQACEAENWNDSLAKGLCQKMRKKLIFLLAQTSPQWSYED